MSLINFSEAAKAKIERGDMPDLGMIARATKRVTLDDIYVSLDSLRDQQTEDSRHLNQRIDTVSQRVDSLGQRVDNLGQRIDSLNQKIDQKFDTLSQKIDAQGQRMDTVMQMLLDLSKQISSQKNQ